MTKKLYSSPTPPSTRELRLGGRRDLRGQEIDLGPIERLLALIVRDWRPTAIWLFGSRARGHADGASDWDLLVVVPDDAMGVENPLAGWSLQKEAGIPCDLMFCRTADFQEDHQTPNTIAFEAAHYGVPVYER